MKAKKIMLAVLLVAVPFFGFAQEWDDIYADPAQNEPVKVQKEKKEQQKKKVVIVQGKASNMEVTANGRDIDEYNRRGSYNNGEPADTDSSGEYEAYEYTDRIVRFHDPESSIKITGADEVIVYVGDDIYESYNNRGLGTNIYLGMGWGSYYPWYNSWYYPWYDPWYYGGWYSPWYYGGWYDPWYYGFGGWYGWHSPWYNRWYSPWYYGGGWYDPWYYGGGYTHGFYDGFYSSLTRNRSGRSTGVYRTSSANRASSATAGLSGRYSGMSTRGVVSGRSSGTSTRSNVSGRTATSLNNRGSSTAPRTRIIDNSGRMYDSRTGRVIDRSGTTSRSSSVNRSAESSWSNEYNSGRSSGRSYERNATTPSRTYQRSSSAPSSSYNRSSSTSSRRESYSAPSRSSSSERSSSSYSAPSRSSSSGSFGGSSSSSGGSSRSSSGSSGRSSGNRR